MQTLLSKRFNQAARASAVLTVGALSLGSSGGTAIGEGLTARTSTLEPLPTVQQPAAPIVQEAVITEGAVQVVQAPKKTALRSSGGSYGDGSDAFWARLRKCESGGNYQTNTGNGYYGAYQYNNQTWGGYGGYQNASEAPPEVQDRKAKETYAKRGAQPWPSCGRR